MIPTPAQIEEFVLNLEALTQREVIGIELSLADGLAVILTLLNMTLARKEILIPFCCCK